MELFESFKSEALAQVENFIANFPTDSESSASNTDIYEKVKEYFSVFKAGNTQQVIDSRRIALEYSLRQITLSTGATYTKSAQQLQSLFNCLDLVLLCAEQELCDALLPLTLLEELLDTQTIEGCEKVFTFLERKIDRFTVGMVAGKGKGLVFLRLCNELLRRLSKTKNTVFCGRILILLAKVFPLGERSGVNLRGDFNIENGTVYEEALMEDDAQEAQEEYKFYKRFWSLQQYFANPPLFFQQDNHATVKEEVENILNEFKKITSNDYTLLNANEKAQKQNGKKRTREDNLQDSTMHDVFASTTNFFFPKFLSSRNLMALELEDPHFRRHILVQILIFMHYLMSFTASEKEKHTVLKTPNKSVIQTFSLEPEQETWISQLWQDTILLLQSTPPNGKLFTETVLYILDHEKNWVNWKNESCPPFEKAPLLASESLTDIAQKRVKLSIPASTIKNAVGTRTLTKLWDLGKEDKDFFSEFSNRRTAPPLLEYLDQIGNIKAKINSSDPEEVETAQSKRWRALRMASKQYLCCFGRIGNGDLTNLKKEVLNEINKANEVPKPVDHGKHSGDNVKQVEPQKPDGTKLVKAEKSDDTKLVDAEKSDDTKLVEAGKSDDTKLVEVEKSNDTKLDKTEKSDDSKNVPNATAETPQESITAASSEPLEQNTAAGTANSPEVAVVTEAAAKAVDVLSDNTQAEHTNPEPNSPVSDPPKSPTIVNPSDDSVKNEDNSPSQAEV